jgi:hypothetical protein
VQTFYSRPHHFGAADALKSVVQTIAVGLPYSALQGIAFLDILGVDEVGDAKGTAEEYHSWSPKAAFEEGYLEIPEGKSARVKSAMRQAKGLTS